MAVNRDNASTPGSVTDAYAPGLRGFIQAGQSLLTGIRITAAAARRRPLTVRYPAEKLTVSARWRGALRLRGVLGRDDIAPISSTPDTYLPRIADLHAADRLPPCVGNCPANVDARGQAALLADGHIGEAYGLVRERNILPGVLGRICHHPCETVCRRGYYDEPIAIRPLHRFAFEEFQTVRPEALPRLAQTRGKTVGIVGSGPSGLAAALDLMRLGYGVVVYERDTVPGGALQSGVPSYRLPREVLAREIQDLVEMGMDLRCGVEVGKSLPLGTLTREHDAVLLAVGLQLSRILPIPGSAAEGVLGALEFLSAVNENLETGISGKRVLVIGGGNVAVDVARCALRVGASEVRLACLEADDEMPCHPWEIAEALDEGAIAMCGLGPEEVLTEEGRVSGMKMRSCASVFDEAGRFAPQFTDEYTEVSTDVVVFAIGQAAKLDDVVRGTELLVSGRGQLSVDGSNLTTNVPGIFACGEVVTGPGSAIGSIATGHEAATSIHRYLEGVPMEADRVRRPVPVPPKFAAVDTSGLEPSRLRAVMPFADPEERSNDFRQVELGLEHDHAMAEATRCLRCDSEVCVGCTFCARTCPDYAIQVERTDEPGARCLTRYELDLTKCCFCGLCAEQCPTRTLTHTGQYELAFYHRELMVFDKGEMVRDGSGDRATGRDGITSPACPTAPGKGPAS